MKALVKAMSNPANGKLITIADAVNSVYANELGAYGMSDVDPAVITE